MIGDYDFRKFCTPAGIMEMLKYEGIEIAGKSCGNRPLKHCGQALPAMLLLHANGKCCGMSFKN